MKSLLQILLLFLLLIRHLSISAQDSIGKINRLTVNGYIKNLQTLTFSKNFRNLVGSNLLHNRVNLKWKPSATIIAAAEFRNRLFWGEEIKTTPGFKNLLRNDNEVFNLSKLWIDNSNLLLHTNTERLWFEYRGQKWNIRLGRQRINWGIATAWNPNDIFNSYNFLDFDYEERPGSDAAKAQYLLSDFSHIEIAASPSGKKDRTVIAAKYFFNKGGYDMQLLAGLYRNRATLGMGWAGSIGDAGFKGEGQLFFKNENSGVVFNGTIETDYVFEKGWYLSGSFLYSSEGQSHPASDWSEIDFSPSPEKLMPTRWNILLTAAKEFTPLFSARLSSVYSFNTNLFILFPSIDYNIAENFTINLVWQSFFADLNNRFEAVTHRGFLRAKWNF